MQNFLWFIKEGGSHNFIELSGCKELYSFIVPLFGSGPKGRHPVCGGDWLDHLCAVSTARSLISRIDGFRLPSVC